MNYGVTITGGAVPWQIFQQNSEGVAPIRLWGSYHLIRLSQELHPQVPPPKIRETGEIRQR